MTPSVERLTVRIFADGADLAGIVRMAANPLIQGFTTNPTLMRKAGIADYAGFAREVLGAVTERSVFAGRIADTGRDPVPIMSEAVAAVNGRPNTSLIWASPRELLNVFQADAIGCHIITATHDILGKLGGVGKDLTQFSLETVAMCRSDAVAAGFGISPSTRATVDRPEQDHHARNTQ